jgi:hypothetical protein
MPLKCGDCHQHKNKSIKNEHGAQPPVTRRPIAVGRCAEPPAKEEGYQTDQDKQYQQQQDDKSVRHGFGACENANA